MADTEKISNRQANKAEPKQSGTVTACLYFFRQRLTANNTESPAVIPTHSLSGKSCTAKRVTAILKPM